MVEEIAVSSELHKKEWYKKVVHRLKEYKNLLDTVDLYTYVKDCGRLDLLSPDDREEEEKRIKYKQQEIYIIQKALTYLDYDMLLIVENSYLKSPKPKDLSIMLDLAMGHTAFYKRKNEAIRKLAGLLNMI